MSLYSGGLSGRYPIRLRTSNESSNISYPATLTVPLVAGMKPVMTRIVVVLPAPFGPRKPEDLTGGGGEADVTDGDHVAVALGEVADFNHRDLRRNSTLKIQKSRARTKRQGV